MSLIPVKQETGARTMSFFDALRKIQEGKSVQRVSWGNNDYCFLKEGTLNIFTKGNVHSWIISDGDMEGEDWIVVREVN